MSGNQRKSAKLLWRIAQFVLMPLLFAAVGLGLLYGSMQLLFSDTAVYLDAMFLDDVPQAQTQTVKNLFAGAPAQPEEAQPLDADGVPYVPLSSVDMPPYESIYGQIDIPSANISCPLVYGDSDIALESGAGQYMGSKMIGFGGTTLIAGHANTFFETLPTVSVGDTITVTTFYGMYQYTVTDTKITIPFDKTAYDLAREDENLVCYTCYSSNSAIGNVKKRFFLSAAYVSGPLVK